MYITGKYKPIWERQRGRCYYCGNTILKDSKKAIIQTDVIRSRSNSNKTIAYVHECCATKEAEFYESEWDIETPFDLHEMLIKMQDKPVSHSATRSKFDYLGDYFRHRGEAILTLTFKEIGEILGEPLCATAYKSRHYWTRRSDGSEKLISNAWLSNGYDIRNLSFEKKHVVFEKKKDMGGVVDIPQVFLTERIPHNAKVEVEHMLDYIRKKYAI